MKVTPPEYLKSLHKFRFYPDLVESVCEMQEQLAKHAAQTAQIERVWPEHLNRQAHKLHCERRDKVQAMLGALLKGANSRVSRRKLYKQYCECVDEYSLYMSNWASIAHSLSELELEEENSSEGSVYSKLQDGPLPPTPQSHDLVVEEESMHSSTHHSEQASTLSTKPSSASSVGLAPPPKSSQRDLHATYNAVEQVMARFTTAPLDTSKYRRIDGTPTPGLSKRRPVPYNHASRPSASYSIDNSFLHDKEKPDSGFAYDVEYSFDKILQQLD